MVRKFVIATSLAVALFGTAFAQVSQSSKSYSERFAKIQENDILWKKRVIREVSTNDLSNQVLNDLNGGGSLSEFLFNAVSSGKLQAYGEGFKGLNNPMNKTQLLGVAGNSNKSEVQRYLVVEDWLYLKSTGQIQRRIFSIAPAGEKADNETSGAFWIDYRQAWDFLNQKTVEMPGNKVVSLADVFDSQLISSKIISVNK